MIKSLTGLRGIAAIVVMLYHMWSGTLATEACMAMITMMAMSGMVNAMHHSRVPGNGRQYWRYLALRLAHILPLHWLTLGALLIAGNHTVNWVLGANALLIHAWIPDLSVCYSFNTMSWFLSALIPCYILLPTVCHWLQRVPVKWQASGLVLALAVEAMWLLTLEPGPQATWAAFVAPPVQFVNFVAGIIACNVWQSLPKRSFSTASATAVEASVAVTLAAVAWITHTGPLPARLGAPYCLWILLTVMVTLCLTAESNGAFTRILSSRLLQWLGGISFEIFMTHGMVCTAVLHAVPQLTSLPWGCQAAACMVPVAVAAWAVNHLLRPVTGKLKSTINSRFQ